MNTKLYNRLLSFASALKPAKQNGEKFHVAYITRKNRVMCVGWNDYKRPHNSNRFGRYFSNKIFPNVYKPCVHAEISALIRFGEQDMSNYDMTVIRIDNNGDPALSMPCQNCQRVLASLNINRVYYSTKEGIKELSL